MYSGLTGWKLTAWLSLSFFTESPQPMLTPFRSGQRCCHAAAPSARVSFLCSWPFLCWLAAPGAGHRPPCLTQVSHRSQSSRREEEGQPRSCDGPWGLESLGLCFSEECRNQSVLRASPGLGAHIDLQTKDQPLKIFSKWSNHDLQDGILFPFFGGEFLYLLCTWGDFIVQLFYYLLQKKNIFVNGSIISAVSLLVHRKFPFRTGAHSFCSTIVHFMACHTKKKSFLFYFFQCCYYCNSLKSGSHFIYTTSLG